MYHAASLVEPITRAPVATVLRHVEAFAGLRDGWGSLAGGRPLDGPAWHEAAASTLLDDDELAVLTVGPSDAPTAVAPLAVRRRPRRLELLGQHDLYEPGDLLAVDSDALDELAAAVLDLGLPVVLPRIPASSPTPDALERAGGRRWLLRTEPAPPWPAVDLDGSWSEPEARLSSGRRSDVRRARRRAEAFGPVDATVVSPRPDEVDALLDTAFAVEAASWKGRTGTALLLDTRRAAFFRTFARDAAADGCLRVAFLRLGDETAAMQLAVEGGGREWLLKIGYDERFARCSPGVLLLLHAIGDAARRGVTRYELLGSDEAWLALLPREVTPCVALRAVPLTAAGAPALVDRALRAGWARVPRRAR